MRCYVLGPAAYDDTEGRMEQWESPLDAPAWEVRELPHHRTEEETGEFGAGSSTFGQTYREYLPRTYRYLRTRTTSAEDAADLTQQVFLRAWEAFPRYQDRGLPLAAWLFSIACHAATDYHRRRRITVTWDLLPETLHPMQQHDLDDGVLQREAVERLRALLLRLDADDRELVVLRFVSELTLQEIGLIVGKSESGVQRQLGRILRRLKEQYRDE